MLTVLTVAAMLTVPAMLAVLTMLSVLTMLAMLIMLSNVSAIELGGPPRRCLTPELPYPQSLVTAR
jgi:hypothetical protein